MVRAIKSKKSRSHIKEETEVVIALENFKEKIEEKSKMILIRTMGLSKYYGKNAKIKAVDNLEFKVYKGETFGLLGPNGAGKTTIVRLLNSIIKPTSGTAIVNGFDILKDTMDVKRTTGMLFESPGLYEKLSTNEFLEFIGALY
ncbi:MAG: ATP-binding cassette domain-containing protein, partial [Promethearchaeota archaeon]